MMVAVGVLASACGDECKVCQKGKCVECKLGFGLKDEECLHCNRTNCLNCDKNEEDCSKCAPYHYREPVEGGKYHECSKCGFGCEQCANKEKCMECGGMFIHSVVDHSNCVVNHAKLFMILVTIMSCICMSSCLAFWCTPGAGEVSLKLKRIRELEALIKQKDNMINKLAEREKDGGHLMTEGDTARMRLDTDAERTERKTGRKNRSFNSGSDDSSSSDEEAKGKSSDRSSDESESRSSDSDESKESGKKSKA